MKIPDFTKLELDYIIANANLTKDEENLMWLRNNEHSLEECAEIMDYSLSTIKRINKRLKDKIIKIL
jgi:hydrogenase maturation factor HypF (carbamoyltransferase family)